VNRAFPNNVGPNIITGWLPCDGSSIQKGPLKGTNTPGTAAIKALHSELLTELSGRFPSQNEYFVISKV